MFTASAMAYGTVHSPNNKLATVQMLRSRRIPWSERCQRCYQRQQLAKHDERSASNRTEPLLPVGRLEGFDEGREVAVSASCIDGPLAALSTRRFVGIRRTRAAGLA